MLSFSEKNQSLLVRSKFWREQQEWESAFEACEGVTRITSENYGLLKSLLSSRDEPDTYLTTPNYYCYTGRNGLWVYQDGEEFIVLCWHPNTAGEILVFPQFICPTSDILFQLLDFIPVPPVGVRLARIGAGTNLAQDHRSGGARCVALRGCEETVLDWKYPVHILDTAKVAALVGGKYMHMRNRLRQLKGNKVEVVAFDAVAHSRALENLLHRWAKHNAAVEGEYAELYAPYDSLFSWSMEKESGLEGLMVFVDDTLQAVGLWDVCNPRRDTANLFVNFCNVTLPGLSELLIVKSCERLQANGVAYLNLGGSETPGLDNFKRKFDPAFSLDLRSYQVLIEDPCKRSVGDRAVA